MERLSQLLAGLPHRARLARAELPLRWQAWREALREDPTLFWRTSLVQLGGLVLIVLLLLAGAQWLIAAFAPAGDKTFVEPTPTAILFVACTHPDCLHAATVSRPRDFKTWPLTCERCKQPSVYRATRCPTCNQWFAPAPSQPGTTPSDTSGNPGGPSATGSSVCPHCARRSATSPAPLPETPPATEDTEDPW